MFSTSKLRWWVVEQVELVVVRAAQVLEPQEELLLLELRYLAPQVVEPGYSNPGEAVVVLDL
jgi:hypothetical protein